jgi:hypothetical protein
MALELPVGGAARRPVPGAGPGQPGPTTQPYAGCATGVTAVVRDGVIVQVERTEEDPSRSAGGPAPVARSSPQRRGPARDVELRVLAIVAEQLGVDAEAVTPDVSLTDDLAADCSTWPRSRSRSPTWASIYRPGSRPGSTCGQLVAVTVQGTRRYRVTAGGVLVRAHRARQGPRARRARAGPLSPYALETIAEDARQAGPDAHPSWSSSLGSHPRGAGGAGGESCVALSAGRVRHRPPRETGTVGACERSRGRRPQTSRPDTETRRHTRADRTNRRHADAQFWGSMACIHGTSENGQPASRWPSS